VTIDVGAVARRTAELIRDVPDHPEPGVVFKDITPLLADALAFDDVVRFLAGCAEGPVDVVVGIEARGFILGAPVALALGAGFVPVRKSGKLPGPTIGQTYDLEYGSAEVELHPETIPDGARVLVVDDVLATGGTAAATANLVERAGGTVVGLAFLLELEFLPGRDTLNGYRVESLVAVR